MGSKNLNKKGSTISTNQKKNLKLISNKKINKKTYNKNKITYPIDSTNYSSKTLQNYQQNNPQNNQQNSSHNNPQNNPSNAQQIKEPNSTLKIILNIITFIILIFLFIALYILYENIPRSPEPLNIKIENNPENISNKFSPANQFYTNMRFNHNIISYKINFDCKNEVRERMLLAFKELSLNGVTKISFKEINSNPDIIISCTDDSNEISEKNYFIAGEGGAREIIPTGRFHIIETGIIYFFDENKKSLKCDYPNIELHELMHVLGFDHSEDKNSLMFPFLESCDQRLDKSLIDELNRLYSQKNLPELFFQDISSVKKGKYLDYNLTIKNSGSISSENVTLTIIDNDQIVDVHNIGPISYGAGISLHTTNLRLKRRNPEKITFAIDYENKVKEIDESNNIAITKF